MKKTLFTLSLLLIAQLVSANPKIDLGLSLGSSEPLDSKILEHFRRDFYIQGHLGVRDPQTGFELRGNLGHYGAPSIHANDTGTDTRLEVTPLTASLLYHIGSDDAAIQPYLGGGVGAYFYGMKDSTYGTLDSGTRFGSHILAGIKFNVAPNIYIGAEYTRTFASPIIFSQSSNFDQNMFTFGIGILSSTEAKEEPTKANREDYQSLLLSQINDLTLEVQKIKENKRKVELRIDAFYEKNTLNEYVSLYTVLDQPLNGQKIAITHPHTKSIIAEGLIDTLEQNETEIKLLLRNEKGWQLPVLIEKKPILLRVGGKGYPELTLSEIKTAIQVERIRDDQEFAQELRRTQYLEGQLRRIEKSLSDAETQLELYHQQWKETQPKTNTVIHQVEESYRYQPRYEPSHRIHIHERPYNYRYYHPQDYVVPVYVPSTPPSPAEKEQFIEAKKERIREIRNR